MNKLKTLLTTTALILLTAACSQFTLQQTLQPPKKTNIYSAYILKIMTMTEQELRKEYQQQQKNSVAKIMHSSEKIMLLQALYHSPVYSPYQAKASLNTFIRNKQHYANDDFAILLLLKDQLNQQLNLREQLVREQQQDKLRKKKRINIEQQLSTMQEQIKQLTTQIKQLKHIEQSISEQGSQNYDQ